MRTLIFGFLASWLVWGQVSIISTFKIPSTPTDSPGAGSYGSTQSVTFAAINASRIVYTNDGTTTPTCTGTGTLYSGAVSTAATTTYKVIGCSASGNPSSVLTSTYTITASCSTQAQTVGGTSEDNLLLGYADNIGYTAGTFTAGSSYTLCALTLRLAKAGSPTFSVKASIYTNSAGLPGTLVGTASGSVALSGVGTTEQDVSFTGLSASLTSGTAYWIVIQSLSPPYNYTDYGIVYYAGGTATQGFSQSANGTTWDALTGYHQFKFTSYR